MLRRLALFSPLARVDWLRFARRSLFGNVARRSTIHRGQVRAGLHFRLPLAASLEAWVRTTFSISDFAGEANGLKIHHEASV
jgi:hypothetical protein